MKKLIVLIAILTSAQAAALPFMNFYIDGFGGANFLYSKEDIKYKSGHALGGALGLRLAIFRLELEGSYRENPFKSIIVEGNRLPLSGSLETFALLGNGIIEFPVFINVLIPYCGIGIGQVWNAKDFKVLSEVRRDDLKGSSPACQAVAGIALSFFRTIEAAGEYRYLVCDNRQNYTLDLKIKLYF